VSNKRNNMKKEISSQSGNNSCIIDTTLLLDNSPKAMPEIYDNEANIFDFKIKESGVNNISVVARFGSGKSSVIETYLDKRRQEEQSKLSKRKSKKYTDTFTRISLGSFNDDVVSDSSANEISDDSAIERSILQQLLYSQPASKLPNSKIERTKATSKKRSLLFAILFTLCAVCNVCISWH